MQIATTIAEVREFRRSLLSRTQGSGDLGLIPTMGSLHAGHLSLVRASLSYPGATAVSIFVNPTQFGPKEDYERYPRDIEADCRMLEAEGVDLVFAPSVEEMYPAGEGAFVEVPFLSDRLDGASRPGHFRGVATVVTKLLNIFQPARIYFGQKDAVQAAIIRRLLLDLRYDTVLDVRPTVRDTDGLALSSRNRYLDARARRQALVLPRALEAMSRRVAGGEYGAVPLLAEGRRVLASEPEVLVDYLAIVDRDTLADLRDVRGGGLIAVAASVGGTRLIDNLPLVTA